MRVNRTAPQPSPPQDGWSGWEGSARASRPSDFFQHKIKEKINSNFLLVCSAPELARGTPQGCCSSLCSEFVIAQYASDDYRKTQPSSSKDARLKLVTADDRGKSSLSNVGNFLERCQQTDHQAVNEASGKSLMCYRIQLHSTSPFKVLPFAIFGKLRASSTVKNAEQDAQNFYLRKNPRKAKTESCSVGDGELLVSLPLGW